MATQPTSAGNHSGPVFNSQGTLADIWHSPKGWQVIPAGWSDDPDLHDACTRCGTDSVTAIAFPPIGSGKSVKSLCRTCFLILSGS
jgi:hypothetical protein